MLRILREGKRFEKPCALLLGGFDGLHGGHRTLLERAKRSGLPVGLSTIYGGKGRSLFTIGEREYLFSQNGVHFVIELPFTEQLRETSAEAFLQELFCNIPVQLVVCGEDFRFGRGAEGTPRLVERLAPCPVAVLPVTGAGCAGAEGEAAGSCKLSTTACKQHLERGELSLLNACLGPEENFFDCAYFIGGEVEHGRRVGRTYGFPTLNLSVSEQKLLPPDGVYGGVAATPKGNFPAIINIGSRPTFGVEERKIESYLLGFSGDLYGAQVRIYPTQFYRKIEKFADEEALKAQLERDVARLKMSI